MKRILFITPFSPDNQGIGVSYTSQLLKELSINHIVDLVYFRYINDSSYLPQSENVNVVYEKVVSKKDKLLGALLQPLMFPLFSCRYSKDVCRYLQKKIKDVHYDFVYFDFSQTFSYARYIDHPNKILMSHDVIAQKYARMKTYLRPWAMATERKLLQAGTMTFTFSQKDCDLLKSLYGINSMYTTFFLNENVLSSNPEKLENYFVFFGAWSRVENAEGLVWFLDNVYDALPKSVGFKIIGGGMSSELKLRLSELSNVEYLGFVDNPYPIISNAKAEIAALHMGAGVKVKCVEALGAGTPIIGTHIAFEGIGDEFNDFMLLANEPEEYIKYIIDFPFSLDDKKLLKNDFIEKYNTKNILKYINQ